MRAPGKQQPSLCGTQPLTHFQEASFIAFIEMQMIPLLSAKDFTFSPLHPEPSCPQAFVSERICLSVSGKGQPESVSPLRSRTTKWDVATACMGQTMSGSQEAPF